MKKIIRITLLFVILIGIQFYMSEVYADPRDIGVKEAVENGYLIIQMDGKRTNATSTSRIDRTYKYTGEEIKPEIKVFYYEREITNLFKITYSNNIESNVNGHIDIEYKGTAAYTYFLEAHTSVRVYFRIADDVSNVLGGSSIDAFNPKPHSNGNSPGRKFTGVVGTILGIIRIVGTIISVGALMVIGIKMMISSVEEKSILKQALPGYILGAIMVFAITWLPHLIYNIVKSVSG